MATPMTTSDSSLSFTRIAGHNIVQIDESESFNTIMTANNDRVHCSKLVNQTNNVCIIGVTGMTCNSCVKLIETSLPQQCTGVNGVCVSLKRNEAFVEFNPNDTTPLEISTAIYDMGFDTEVTKTIPLVSTTTPSISGNLPIETPTVTIVTLDSVTASLPAPNQSTASIHVTGMVCQSCVHNIETNISSKPGIMNVKVTLETESAIILYDPTTTTINNICNLIDELGFVAVPLDKNQFVKRDENDINTFRVGIEGMTCHSCVSLIEEVVSKREGVVSVVVSLANKEGTIQFVSNIVSVDQIKEDIEDTGFNAMYFIEVTTWDKETTPNSIPNLSDDLDVSIARKGGIKKVSNTLEPHYSVTRTGHCFKLSQWCPQ